jgi:8-hydroxy-5-deazaflavin:NADPH oxidoreductase
VGGADVDIKIGMIGAGKLGGTAARLFSWAGYPVAIANSRGPGSIDSSAAQFGPNVRVVTAEEAAEFGEVVLLAIPFGAYESIPARALSGKIVIDAMNYFPQRDGEIDLGGLGSSEFVARRLPGARIVKAFNTMHFETLGAAGNPGVEPAERLVIFIAGDDGEAKAVVARLIEEVGFTPMDTGSLREGGRRLEPDSPLFRRPLDPMEAREILERGQKT